MNLNLQKIFFYLILGIVFSLKGLSQKSSYQPEHLFSVDQLKSDFQFLRAKLEKIHPDLYLYSSRAELNLLFDSLYQRIISPSTERDFYYLITMLNSKIKDGHTMFLPSEEARKHFNSAGKYFPFYIAIAKNKAFVSMNCSADTTIRDGAEILSINGIGMEGILRDLMLRQIRDGSNQTYPIWILTNYFKEYFSFSFGNPFAFTITFRKDSSKPQTKILYALSKDSIRYYRQMKYERRVLQSNEKLGIIFNIIPESSVAELTINSFDEDLLKTTYNQNFENTIRKAFGQIQSSRVESLVLDIRNNQGGDFEPGRFLLSYLVGRPTQYLVQGGESRIIKPDKDAFKGKLYILINGGSFSNSGIVSSCLDLAKRGIFVGEEAGGNKTIISGNSQDFVLPNTKIICEISRTRYQIRKGPNDGHGLLPAYIVIPTVDDIINGKDRVKEFALGLIKESK